MKCMIDVRARDEKSKKGFLLKNSSISFSSLPEILIAFVLAINGVYQCKLMRAKRFILFYIIIHNARQHIDWRASECLWSRGPADVPLPEVNPN